MTDREKVIPHFEDCIKIADCQINHNWVFVRTEILRDAIALLKAQEPIEALLHLCESCTNEYPECEATIDGIEFGCGVGNDNIIGCTAYVNRWKAQEAVKPEVDVDEWRCGKCGHPLEHQEMLGSNILFHEQYAYCPNCGRKVKWE